jgi:hypothetical protein
MKLLQLCSSLLNFILFSPSEKNWLIVQGVLLYFFANGKIVLTYAFGSTVQNIH